MFDVLFRFVVLPTMLLGASVALAVELRHMRRDTKACV